MDGAAGKGHRPGVGAGAVRVKTSTEPAGGTGVVLIFGFADAAAAPPAAPRFHHSLVADRVTLCAAYESNLEPTD